MSALETVELATVDNTPDRLYDKDSDKLEHCESQSSTQSTSVPVTSTSWAYIKWLLCVAVSGLFSCGTSVLEAAFDYPWPVVFHHRAASSNSQAPLAAVPEEREVESCEKSLRSVELTEETTQVEQCLPLKNQCTFYVVEQSLDFSALNGFLHSDSEASRQPTDLVRYTEVPNDSELSCTEEFDRICAHPCSFTLLNALYADSRNGIIDENTRDTFVNEVLTSVIPRNLSDSSEVSITPYIRKMYAWSDSPSYSDDVTDQTLDKHNSDIQSCGSDLQFAYPGKLTMSDSSFSPLSPGTAESNTPTGERAQTPSDLGLPDIDRRDHTLAWAMSNLKVTQEMRTELEVLGISSQPTSRMSCDRPPLPNSRERQSRERSPVTTINSMRLTDTLSLPTFAPFEGHQMFDKSSNNESTEEVPKPKRSSSLKSTRTPPGTPGQKAVRFADALGLDLATVRHVFDQENPPKIPASATFDLQLDSDECIAKLGAKQFGLCFAQPGAASNFIRRVLNETVCLEDCHVDMPRGVLTGTVRVKSLGFEKHIAVRITYNNWVTFFDTQASYVQGSHDGATDRFSFSVVFPDTMAPGDRAQFAVRYETHTGEQFWDNNHGQNYSVTCYAKATDLAGDGSWVHYL